jgi:hypothetical protein
MSIMYKGTDPLGVINDTDKAKKSDLTSIFETGTTASQAISAGTYFYLDGELVRAKTAIASGATFTKDTNYEVVTAGALNDTFYKAGDLITITPTDYIYGLAMGNSAYVNIQINKPIKASKATINNFPSSVSFGSIGGIKTISNIVVSSVTIGTTTIQIVLSSSNVATITSGTPIIFGTTFRINFS